VTFDCWSTLIYEVASTHHDTRAVLLAEMVGAEEDDARTALRTAWREHQISWHRRTVFTAKDMTRSALDALGVTLDPAQHDHLVRTLEDVALAGEVRALEGARETLRTLAHEGVRIALICDTGFSPGRVVRTLLDRVGVLEFLEVTIFSDEVGAPKPDPLTFRKALEGLGVSPREAVHVGDLRRSDVAGARAFGMGSIRIRAHNDDASEGSKTGAGVIDCGTAGCEPACERPEADAVVDTCPDLLEVLGFGR